MDFSEVGISAELPSGSYSDKNLDYHTFFDFLLNKGQSYETWHGLSERLFSEGRPLFDHVEFGITAKDAKNMSLSTRKLIEHSFLALLDSGINYRGRNIGCYMSATSFDMQGVSEPDELEANGSFAGYPYMVANKVSYHLDLRGPSIPVDTACSSSLTALHLAVQAIRAGDCDAAVLGGCQLNFRLVDFIQYSQGSVLSADGTCKPLDESANGFSRGEGVTVVVVKTLQRAIQDNDHIYATILGTGINSSGSLAPVSAPVASAQKEAMERAFTNIGRTTAEVDYVELHATGTAAGDPTEANWVGEVFGQRHSELLVGSVKGNIGHLEICAFLASLCKICAMFQTRLLPPTVNLSNPNPAIAWDRWNMRAPTEVTSIEGTKSQLLVSIASSGIGESFPEQTSPKSQLQHERPLLVLAGEIGNSIDALWSTTAAEDLPALSSACSRRGRQMPWQTFAIMSKRAATTPFLKPTLVPKSTPRLAKLNSFISKSLGLFSTGSAEKWNIWPMSTTLPAIAMVQLAMFDLLSSVGIVPTAVVGHSAGETAMMYASGACSRDMALEISIARGTTLATLEDLGGSMVALNCGPDQAQLIIDEVTANRTGILQIACYNSDFAVTLAGAEPLLELVVALAKSRDISAHKLRTKVAVHSEFVEQCKVIYRQQVEDVFARYPGDHVPYLTTYSSTFGKIWTQPFTPDYYWQNVRQPVLFDQAIKSITKDFPEVAFVEISPHPVLSTYISNSGVEPDHVLCFMKRAKVPSTSSEPITFLQGVAHLSLIGYTEIDFHSLNDTRPSAKDRSFLSISPERIPFCPESPKTTLAEHVIMGEPILPAAGFLEMVFESGAKLAWNIQFQSMLPLLSERLLPVKFTANGPAWSVSSELPSQPGLLVCQEACGFMASDTVLDAGILPISDLKKSLQVLDISEFYEILAHFGQYGPIYQRVTACWKTDAEALVEIRAFDEDLEDLDKYVIHPALLDACFHAMVHPMFTANADRSVYYLPMSIETVALYDPCFIRKTLPKVVYSHIIYKSWDPAGITFDLSVTDANGTVLCQLSALNTSPTSAERCSLRSTLETWTKGRHISTSIKAFHYDNVLALRHTIQQLPDGETLWIESSQDTHGYAAIGFVRSLQKEMVAKDIRLALFDAKWSEEERTTMVSSLSLYPYIEKEIFVDSFGVIPSKLRNSDTTQPSNSPIIGHQVDDPHPPQPSQFMTEGYCRHVLEAGAQVLGVTSTRLLIRTRLLIQPDALGTLRVVIMQNSSEDAIGHSLNALLTLLGVMVVNVSKPITPKTLDDIRSCNVVFTGLPERCDMDVIASVLPKLATLLSWNAPQAGDLNFLTRNLWMVGDILRDTHDILHKFLGHQQNNVTCLHSWPPIDERKQVSPDDFLFDASKEYYLLGGLGSLGIRAAMWMYENGARMLVLTSRHGDISSLTRSKDEMAVRILSYLQNRPDLRLRLEACDASSESDMSALFRQTDNPIGGCILMSVVLKDRLFIAHDNTSYYTPFPGKVGALTALENAVDIHSLDFLVSVSSAATFGNVGQTNYASANTAVDGLLSKYKNAFSLIAPAIIDSITISHGLNLSPDPRFREWLPWSMTCSELFECLADGIRSMGTQKFSLYVPRFNWYHMKEHFGDSPMYNHLVYEVAQNTEEESATSKKLLHAIVRKHLDVDEADFSADMPFTSYGLDSLSAGRLSHSLRPFLQISQLQLLADITLQDLEQRIQEKEDLPSQLPESASGQTVVKLVQGEGIPLILIHGASGNIVSFIPLQERFNTPLWAIQHTPECPMDSLQAMAAFYFLKIKAARPSGPYRLGGYSGCSLLAFEVAYLLRDSGDRVSQLVMLDHFPTLYSSPFIFPLDDETIQKRRASET
ncbi:polyketide synthase [Pholiota molesta]|nr:polyketide synthase [Pholiota molesta]